MFFSLSHIPARQNNFQSLITCRSLFWKFPAFCGQLITRKWACNEHSTWVLSLIQVCHSFCSIQIISKPHSVIASLTSPKGTQKKFKLLEDGEGMESSIALHKVLSRRNVQDDIILEPVEYLWYNNNRSSWSFFIHDYKYYEMFDAFTKT